MMKKEVEVETEKNRLNVTKSLLSNLILAVPLKKIINQWFKFTKFQSSIFFREDIRQRLLEHVLLP